MNYTVQTKFKLISGCPSFHTRKSNNEYNLTGLARKMSHEKSSLPQSRKHTLQKKTQSAGDYVGAGKQKPWDKTLLVRDS